MKKFILFFTIVTTTQLEAQTITSVMNGNASNPLVWDCMCFPSTSSDIVINHTVNLDVDWAVLSGGSITVNASGQLKQVGEKDLLVDGTTSFVTNHGFTQVDRMAVTNSATITNNNHFSVTEGLYVGATASLLNTDLFDGLDSLMTEGIAQNDGIIYVGNFLNTGAFTNTGHIAADSIGNTGTFYSTSGWIQGTAIGNSGDFYMQNEGFMVASENWWNIGNFSIDPAVELICEMDLYNGDTLGGYASLTNNGTISVAKDFYNGWNLLGSGSICIAEESYNAGDVAGTLDICDNTGSDFDFNIGTIAGTVTHCSPGCFVGLEDVELSINVFPNPTADFVTINLAGNVIYELSNIEGKMINSGQVSQGKVDLSNLVDGVYLLKVLADNQSKVITIIKK